MEIKYPWEANLFAEDVSSGDLLQQLEHRVAKRYRLIPVTSRRQTETLDVDGECVEIQQRVFAVGFKGEVTTKEQYQMVEAMWADIANTYEKGSFVMWRRLPSFELETGEDKCQCCGHASTYSVSRLTCRLGAPFKSVLETAAGEIMRIINNSGKELA